MTDTQPSPRRAATLALVATSGLWVGSLIALPRHPTAFTLVLAAVVIATPLAVSILLTQYRVRGLLIYLVVAAGGATLLISMVPRDEPVFTALVLVGGLGALAYGISRYGPTLPDSSETTEEDIA